MGNRRTVAKPSADLPNETMNRSQVRRVIAVSDSTLDRWIRAGKFPAPMQVAGRHRYLWRRADVEAWLAGSDDDPGK